MVSIGSELHMNKISAFRNAIIVGISSDIGMALYQDWIKRNWNLSGTYRTQSDQINKLLKSSNSIFHCDLRNSKSIDKVCLDLKSSIPNWDLLVFGPGLQEPIGLFSEVNFDEWAESLTVNFTSQLRFLHNMISKRRKFKNQLPSVIFFAGGGVNNAPTHYSAYTVSKIAMIKMVELLAAEFLDTNFVIIGPGWVNTKIHKSILRAGVRAGPGYEKTLKKIKENDFTSLDEVVSCCNKLIQGSGSLYSGRNYSVAFDSWDDENFEEFLKSDPNIYKLRRFGNDF